MPVTCAACGLLGCVFLYFGTASALYYGGDYEAALTLYPGYTNAWLTKLTQAEDTQQMDAAADRILGLNGSASIAYSAKARVAYANGDFASVFGYKEKAISLAKYSLEEYLDYFDMLYVGVQLYEQNGDDVSAGYCIQKLQSIPDMLSAVLDGTSPLAWRIDEQPELTLPAEYQAMLETLAPPGGQS